MAGTGNAELVFVPLGGVGEIGMNFALYGFGPANAREWIVVDCGVTFPDPAHPGVRHCVCRSLPEATSARPLSALGWDPMRLRPTGRMSW